MNVGTIWANLNLNMQGFSSGLRQASASANAFATSLNGRFNGIGAVIDDMAKAGKKSKFEFKDVARIVQGIIISKIFYSGLQAIRNCTDAVWEFSNSLEYAKIAYTNLFSDQALAEEFMNVLKDFAAKTPFSFTESEQAAKRLLAYGVQYKNVMYMMKGVMSAASMQGDPAKVESISRALGQIYTKGRVMNEEMRQLAEAGIPAYEILREKLGLTQKQLQNLGDESIGASTAINALVDGMTERFGNVVDASSRTMEGIISNIKDNATMLASGLFEPMFTKFKSFFDYIGQALYNLRDIFETQGAGGVFEALVPKELQPMIRQLIANFQMLGMTIKNLLVTIGDVLQPVLMAFVVAFNAIAPVILNVVNVLSALISILFRNETVIKAITFALAAAAAMWVAFKVRAIASAVVVGVVTAISKALAILSSIMTFVAMHPLWAILIAGVGIITGLSGGFNSLGKAISGAFKNLTKISGIDPDNMLLPSQKERANDLDKFNKKLDGTADNMDDLADKTGKAAKAAKQLLSFDEVFKLKEPDESTKAGDTTNNNIDISDISVPSGDAYIPEVPSFEGFVNDYVNKLKSAFGNISNKLKNAGIGATLAGALTYLLTGSPVLAAIAAAAGAIVGYFWDDIAEALGLTDTGKLAVPLATALGTAIGFLVGGPAGAVLGTAIGLLVGWLIDGIAYGIETGDWSRMATPLCIGLGAGIGFLVGGPVGAVLGVAIGLLVDWLFEGIMEGLETGDWSKVATPLGTGLGAAIGFVAGGPLGAAVGALIGALVGWITQKIMENWDDVKEAFIAPFRTFGEVVTGIWEVVKGYFDTAFSSDNFLEIGWNILKGIVAGIGAAIYTIFLAIGSLFQAAVDALKAAFGIASPAKKMKPYGKNILLGIIKGFIGAIAEVAKAIGTFFITVGTALADGASDIFDKVATWFSGVLTAVGNFFSSIFTAVGEIFTNIKNTISTIISAIWSVVSTVFTSIKDAIVGAITIAWNFISSTFNSIKDAITTAVNAAWTAVTNAFTKIKDTIATMITAAWNTVSSVFTSIKDFISDKVKGALSIVKDTFKNIKEAITGAIGKALDSVKSVFTTVKDFIGDKVLGAYNKVKDAFGNIFTSVRDKLGDMKDAVKEKLKGMLSAFTGWIGDLWDKVFNKLFGWIGDAIQGFKDMFAASTEDKVATGDAAKAIAPPAAVNNKVKTGHATGGIFDREHIARFAEGDKAEAIIPLENAGAMQPFVDAVSDGLTASLAPIVANMTGSSNQQPIYVGTLIADDRSLKELERRMEIIRLQEGRR